MDDNLVRNAPFFSCPLPPNKLTPLNIITNPYCALALDIRRLFNHEQNHSFAVIIL